MNHDLYHIIYVHISFLILCNHANFEARFQSSQRYVDRRPPHLGPAIPAPIFCFSTQVTNKCVDRHPTINIQPVTLRNAMAFPHIYPKL
jgi:hypothetical protein